MRKEKEVELYEEFLNKESILCGLCGNWGFIDTRGKVFSPAGYHAGVLAFCICPNGRIMKKNKVDLAASAAKAHARNGT